MLRVSTARARPGMRLGRDVYDATGRLVLARGTRLTEEGVALLGRAGSSQIFIVDPRVGDIPVGALFPDELEAKAVRALHTLLVRKEGTIEGVVPVDLLDLQAAVRQMVDRLFPVPLGDPDLCNPSAPHGYDYLHPVKVAEISLVIGGEIGLSRAELIDLGLAAVLQNIGYLFLPPKLLDEPGPLTDTQGHLRRHPEYGVTLLLESGLSSGVVRAIREHHERWDGSGYPTRLRGEEISLLARIVAIGDVYDSLLSRRPHRQELRPHEAVQFILDHSGEMFDPHLAGIFARRIPQYPAGLGVRLNSGHVGIVSKPNTGLVGRPVVRVCVEKGAPVPKPYDINLASPEHEDKVVEQVLL